MKRELIGEFVELEKTIKEFICAQNVIPDTD